MAKSLKKYKRPPRVDREPFDEVEVPRALLESMQALVVSPTVAPARKKSRKRRARAAHKSEVSDDEDGDRVDSGTEAGGFDLQLPSAAIPPKQSAADVAVSVSSTNEVPVEEEGPTIPPATQIFMTKWLPKWHDYCVQFPQPDDFGGVAPYCAAGMDLILAFTRDVTASHISKKSLPFDVSPPAALPWEVQFNNVFYPADKIRNFIDINVRRFEKFRDGEEMEGKMWVDMEFKYRNAVEALLEKIAKLRSIGAWEKENRRVNEMVRYGVFGKLESEDEDGKEVPSDA